MKKWVSLILCVVMLFSYAFSDSVDAEGQAAYFSEFGSQDMLGFIQDSVYADLVDTLDPDMYFVEEVQVVYISQEYLDEVAYNSQANIFFGYTLEELDEQFEGKRYIFTLGEDNNTAVTEFVAYDDSYEKIIRNVAIGAGVILVCVTVAVVTKNPALAVGAGKTIKAVFSISSSMAKGATVFALKGAAISGVTTAVIEGVQTGDFNYAIKQGAIAASEGFKIGAITGAAKELITGLYTVGDTTFFKGGTEQARKYPKGVRFTKGEDGNLYPRFEEYAKAKATFNMPDPISAANHTGLSGIYYWDEKLANAQCGFTSTPLGYVWHHLEDMRTMLLVPQDLHSVAKGGMYHTGGASLIRALLGGGQ